ncbi:MAG: hemolysin family protein [Candidatus Kariarchaeaceae archaeon]|jgi:CBS domain containing-hemolysin-like protein
MSEINAADIFWIILLVLLNGFFVASEFAFVRVRITRISELIANGSRRANRVKTIIEDLDRSLSSTQLGITLASIALGFVGEPFFTELLLLVIHGIDNGFSLGLDVKSFEEGGFIHGLAFFTGYMIITFMHVVIGELAPKSVSIQFAETTALWCAEPLYWFMKITNPLLNFFVWSSNRLLSVFKIPPAADTHDIDYTEDELKIIIKDGIKKGEIEPYESKLIFNIFNFTDSNVKSILTPRIDLKALSVTATAEEIIDLSIETGHSRIPIFDNDLDNVLGFVHIKDVLPYFKKNNHQEKELKIQEIIRPVITVHEGKPLDDLLNEMQKQQIQVSIIVDEYGSVEGIATIEDILEYIVGPIDDEFDTIDTTMSIRFEGDYIFSGGLVTIEELNKTLKETHGEEINSKNSVTLAGYALELFASEIPKMGMKAKDECFEYTICKLTGNRIKEIKIRKVPNEIDKYIQSQS